MQWFHTALKIKSKLFSETYETISKKYDLFLFLSDLIAYYLLSHHSRGMQSFWLVMEYSSLFPVPWTLRLYLTFLCEKGDILEDVNSCGRNYLLHYSDSISFLCNLGVAVNQRIFWSGQEVSMLLNLSKSAFFSWEFVLWICVRVDRVNTYLVQGPQFWNNYS